MGDCEFQLPEEIILHIQSFMREKEADRTTLFSKSWYRARSTRPNLEFNRDLFRNDRVFSDYTKKTMQRYEDLNLNIKTFRLYSTGSKISQPVATDLILRAIRLGVIDLTIGGDILACLGISKPLVLPNEVFESETLARLNVTAYQVDIRRKRDDDLVTYNSKLKSLALLNVTVINGDLFKDLILRFPLLEELSLSQPERLSGDEEIERPCLFYDKLAFHKLKCLELEYLDLGDTLSKHHDLWDKFPCLEKLLIREYSVYERGNDWSDVRICSPSLESISISTRNRIVNLKFDVPNIRKFKFEGSVTTKIQFITTTCREWESRLCLSYSEEDFEELQPPLSWFSSLKQFLKVFSLSRVYLSINAEICDDYIPRYVGDGLPIPGVEKLELWAGRLTLGFLDSLLWSCRPNSIRIENDCLLDLDENVNVELFQQLRFLPRKTLCNVSGPEHEFVEFKLN